MKPNLKTARLIASLLDTRFEILGVRFGFNTIVQLFPGMGDIIAILLSLYIIFIGLRLHVPSETTAKMIANVVLSFFIGLIPGVGDAFYLFYKPDVRNVKLLEKSLNTPEEPQSLTM